MKRHDLPTAEEKTDFVRSMFDSIAHRYDLVNRLITFGLDRRWRQRAVTRLGLDRGSLVLDIGCGTGDLARAVSHAGLTCFGIDLSYEMLAAAPASHVSLIEANADTLPFVSASVDGVISGFALRNFTDLGKVFEEIARVLVMGGRFVILEVDQPTNLFLRFGHQIWFNKVVPKIGALLSDAAAYRYLPKSVAYLPKTAELETMLGASGFGEFSHQRLQGGLAQIIVVVKESEQP